MDKKGKHLPQTVLQAKDENDHVGCFHDGFSVPSVSDNLHEPIGHVDSSAHC